VVPDVQLLNIIRGRTTMTGWDPDDHPQRDLVRDIDVPVDDDELIKLESRFDELAALESGWMDGEGVGWTTPSAHWQVADQEVCDLPHGDRYY